ncbi:MAG: tetratricopeptide repeat protein [Phycisphaerae bacterium]|nr:tetratricopeptide repeat protein [Phycisphaerae bacterium]
MAKKLNKTLVGILTMAAMLLMGVVAVALIYKLPGADPQHFADEAVKQEAKGEWRLAMQNYMRAFRFDKRGGQNPEWLAKAAKCMYELGEVGAVRELVRQARVLDPKLKPAQELATRAEFELARAVPHSPQWKRTLDEAERLLGIDATMVLAQEAAGSAWLALSGEDSTYETKGENALREVLKLDPVNANAAMTLAEFYYNKNRNNAATELINETIAKADSAGAKEALAELYNFVGRRCLFEGKLDDAVAAFEKAQKANPSFAESHLALAAYWQSKGKDSYDKAEAELQKALKVDPKLPDTYFRLAALYQAQQKLNEAVAILEQGLTSVTRGVGFRFVRGNFARNQMLKQICMAHLARPAKTEEERKKAIADAEAVYQRARDEVGPDEIVVRIMKAHLLREKGDLVEATREVEQVDKALARARDFEIKAMLADLYAKQEQFGAATEALREAIAIEPRAIGAHILLAKLLLRQREYDAALAALESPPHPGIYEALRRNPEAAKVRAECYRRLNRMDKVEAERELIREVGGSTPIQEARFLALTNRLDEAEQLLRNEVKSDPKNADAVVLLARVLVQKKDEEGARDVVEDARKQLPDNRVLEAFAISLDPVQDPKVRKQKMLEFLDREPDPMTRAIQKFTFHINRDELDEARTALDEAEKVDPNSPVVIEQQFNFAMRRKDWATAEKYCDREAKLNTDGTGGKLMRGRLAVAKGEFSPAIDLYKQALDAYPTNSIGWTLLAEAYLSAGRRGEARDTLERAIKLNPANGFANRMLGGLALEDGDKARAKALFEDALAQMPNDPFCQAQLQLIREEEDPKSGITAREEAAKKNPEDYRNLMALAKLYAKTGEPAKAEDCLKRVLSANRDDLRFAFRSAEIFAKDLDRPAEGEAILLELLRSTDDKEKKSRIATLTAKFYQDLEIMQNAERYFLLAASLSPGAMTTQNVGEFYVQTNRPRDALDWYEKARDLARDLPSELIGIERRIIQSLILLRDKKRCEGELEKYIAKYPNDEQGLQLKGLFYLQMGDMQQAEKAFMQQLEKQPDSALALWQLGALHMMRNRWELAIEELSKSKAFRPNDFNYDHRIALARALIGTGRVDEGLNELQTILRDKPDAQNVAAVLVDEYLQLKPPRYSDAESLIVTYMRRYPDDYKWPMLLGKVGVSSGDLNKAATAYRRATEISKFAAVPTMSYLSALEGGKQHDQIIEFVTKALPAARRRRLPMAVAALGKAYAAKGDEQAAIEQFGAAMELARDDFEAYRFIALTMSTSLGADKALAYAQKQSDADKNNVERLKILMHLLFSNNKNEEALAIGDRIVQLSDRDDDLLFGMIGQAIILGRLERNDEARKKYEGVLELDPSNTIALNNLAYILADVLKRPQEALPYAEKAENLAPRDANTLDTYGWVLAENNRLADAEGTLLRALDVNAQSVAANYHLGIVYKRMNNVTDARQRLEAARKHAEAQGEENFVKLADQALKELGTGQ